MPFYLFLFLFAYFCFACDMFTANKYFTDDLYNVAISTVIAMVSYNFWLHEGSERVMKALCVVFLLGGLYLSYDIYVNYLQNSNIMSLQYAYGDKNSLAPILLCCGFIVFRMFTPQSRLLYWGGRAIAVAMLFVMILLRSRATFVCGLYILYYFVFKSKNRKLKLWILALSALLGVYVLLNANFYDILFNGIIMAGRDSSDVNQVSSGRFFLIMTALPNIPKHPWVGIGDFYLDCMPIAMLIQYGIIGVAIVFFFLYYIYKKLVKLDKNNLLFSTAFILYMVMLVNGLFEARAPFGPGTKSFMLWMFVAFAFAKAELEAQSDTRRAVKSAF